MKLKDFLNIWFIKFYCVYINPLIIGAIFSSLGSWDYKKDRYFLAKILSLAILFIIYLVTSYSYYKYASENDNAFKSAKENEERLIKKNNAYNKVTLSLTSQFNNSAEAINEISKNILKGGAKLDIWNYKKVCTGICQGVYETLCELTGYDDFSVNVMLYDVNSKGRYKNIKMIAHKSKYEGHPSSFGQPLFLSKDSDFYAVKMFNKGKPDISILTTSEEVKEKFTFSDESNNHPKYSQYVGIPIICSVNHMISLLQICAFNDSTIADKKENIAKIINTYILPYTYFALLTNKVERSLMNSISKIERMEDSDGKK